jgi:MscS family membrane protein
MRSARLAWLSTLVLWLLVAAPAARGQGILPGGTKGAETGERGAAAAAAKPGESAAGEKAGHAGKPGETAPDMEVKAWSFFEILDLKALLQNSLWDWLTLIGAIFLGVVAGKVASAVLRGAGQRLKDHGWEVRAQVIGGLARPASLALGTAGLTVGLAALRMSGVLQVFWAKTLLLIYSIAVLWYVYNLVAVVDVGLKKVAVKTKSPLDEQFAPLVRKTLRIFLVVFWITFVVDSVFEQNIGAWLAGLGIAGLAVSLAAQDSLKNLFGSITILLDRPFHVGERIIYGGYDGTVEEIGFRSTKVRTLKGNLVSIPNSIIVNSPVENVGRRASIQRVMNVTITYDTPREKIEQAVEILRGILEEEGLREPIHPTINGTELPPRVYFNDYNADSLNIFLIYWYAPPAWWDYMDHAQKLNFRIFEEFEKAGIEFAFPTRTLYLAGDPKRELALRMLGGDLPAGGRP